MYWNAPYERDTVTNALEKRLCDAADQFRANSGLTAARFSAAVLGLIFLHFAEARFISKRAVPEWTASTSSRATSRAADPTTYQAEGGIYLPKASCFEHLLNLPEGADTNNLRQTSDLLLPRLLSEQITFTP